MSDLAPRALEQMGCGRAAPVTHALEGVTVLEFTFVLVAVAPFSLPFFPPRCCFCDDMIRRVGYAGCPSIQNEEEEEEKDNEPCSSVSIQYQTVCVTLVEQQAGSQLLLLGVFVLCIGGAAPKIAAYRRQAGGEGGTVLALL